MILIYDDERRIEQVPYDGPNKRAAVNGAIEQAAGAMKIECATCGELTDDERFLHEHNWEHWYAPKGWWVRPDTVSDPTRQDFTNYQLTTEDALAFQSNPKPYQYLGDMGAVLKYIVEARRRAG